MLGRIRVPVDLARVTRRTADQVAPLPCELVGPGNGRLDRDLLRVQCGLRAVGWRLEAPETRLLPPVQCCLLPVLATQYRAEASRFRAHCRCHLVVLPAVAGKVYDRIEARRDLQIGHIGILPSGLDGRGLGLRVGRPGSSVTLK